MNERDTKTERLFVGGPLSGQRIACEPHWDEVVAIDHVPPHGTSGPLVRHRYWRNYAGRMEYAGPA